MLRIDELNEWEVIFGMFGGQLLYWYSGTMNNNVNEGSELQVTYV